MHIQIISLGVFFPIQILILGIWGEALRNIQQLCARVLAN